MEPMHSVSYYLEFQKRLSFSKGSSRKPLVEPIMARFFHSETPVKFIPLVFIFAYAITAFASDSPDTREITDPKSIVSTAAEGVAPISVDDLFYTRSIGAGAGSSVTKAERRRIRRAKNGRAGWHDPGVVAIPRQVDAG